MCYWGNLSCLYSSLGSEDDIEKLEEAISSHQRGLLSEAERLILHQFPNFYEIPVVAIALADIYESQGKEFKRAEVLQKTLHGATSKGNAEALLEILLADATMKSKGWIHSSLEDLLKIKKKLSTFEIQNATELEVCYDITVAIRFSQHQARCLLEYRQAIQTCQRETNSVGETDMDLKFLGDEAPRNQLKRLEIILRNQGNTNAALRLATLQLIQSVNSKTWGEGLEEFDVAISKLESASAVDHPSLTHRAAMAQLFAIQSCMAQKLSGEVDRRMNICQEKFTHLTNNGFSCPMLDLRLQMLQYQVDVPPDLKSQSEGWLLLADRAKTMRLFPQERQCTMRAAEAARENINNSADMSESQDLYRSIGLRRLAFERDTADSRYFLAGVYCMFSGPFCSNGREGEFIKNVDQFLEENPEIDAPETMHSLYSSAESAARRNSDPKKAAYFCELKKLVLPKTASAVDTRDSRYVLSTSGRDDANHYQREVYSRDPLQLRSNATRVLSEWLITELRNQKLSLSMIRTLVGDDGASAVEAVRSNIGRLPDNRRVVRSLYGTESDPASDIVFDARMSVIEDWLRNECNSGIREARHWILKILQQSRCTMLRSKIIAYPSEENAVQEVYDRLCEQLYRATKDSIRILTSIDQGARGPDDVAEAKRLTLASITGISNSATAIRNGLLTDADLKDAIENLGEDLCNYWREKGDLESLHGTLKTCCDLAFSRNVWFSSCTTDVPLEFLEKADEVYCELRRNASVENFNAPNDASAFEAKYTVIQRLNQAIIYQQALRGALTAFHLTAQNPAFSTSTALKKLGVFALWVERSKARTLLDELGVGGKIPKRLLSQDAIRKEYTKAVATEEQLLLRLADATAKWQYDLQIQLRDQIHQHRSKMRAAPELKEIMAIRDGTPISQPEIIKMLQDMGPKTVFVSYIQVLGQAISGLWLVVYRYNKAPLVTHTMTLAEIDAWVKKYLDKAELSNKHPEKERPLEREDTWTALKALEPLLKPLERLTEPGDRIIISQSQSLHRVPIHAIEIGGRKLIERNPVVFCQSLSILGRCYATINDQMNGPVKHGKVSIMCTLPEAQQDAAALDQVESYTGGTALRAGFVSKAAALRSMENASLIHFHGHISFIEGRGLKQVLKLGTESDEGKEDIKHRLEVGDVFSLSLHGGALTLLLGCRSGRAQISSADDLLGLSTAFIYAGSTAIISTLWKIDNDDAHLFTKAFYGIVEQHVSQINENTGSDAVPMLDLAEVMQQTILKLCSDAAGPMAPYRWAAFVLNGYWKIPCAFFKQRRSSAGDGEAS